mmetsp:Transcript_8116/g.9490  ORF Transcript_8116/g.9490 Transcript_8116/m.9490 type:complete len:122 (+) Transcript_8116:120-485(+)
MQDEVLPCGLPTSLIRKLLLRNYPNQRISNEAIVLASELIRNFVQEAHHRAEIEAECEMEINGDDDDKSSCESGSKNAAKSFETDNQNEHTTVDRVKCYKIATIRHDHIAKIACELLMDFS